jgi:hypothetical protein
MVLEFSHYCMRRPQYCLHDTELTLTFAVNDYVCPDLVIVDSALNPNRINFDILPYYPDVLLSVIISVCAIHQVIQSQPDWHLITLNRSRALCDRAHYGELEFIQSFSHPLSSLIYKHRSQALRRLSQYLSEVGAEGSDLVFHLVSAMLMSEVCKPLCPKSVRPDISVWH